MKVASILAAALVVCRGALVDHVNTLQGTYGRDEWSRGNTQPLVGLPWGHSHWTAESYDRGYLRDIFFNPEVPKLGAIRLTHQPSPWMQEWGHAKIQTGWNEDGTDWSMGAHGYDINATTTIWKPYHFGADLEDIATYVDDKIHFGRIEVTASTHGAMLRVKWPPKDSTIGQDQTRYVKLYIAGCRETSHETTGGKVRVKAKGHQFQGGNVANLENANLYIVMDLDVVSTDIKGRCAQPEADRDDLHDSVKAFYADTVNEVNVRIGVSLINYDMAELRLNDQIGTDSFDELMAKHKQMWEDHLSVVKITDTGIADDAVEKDLLDVFYSSLYRSSIFPRNLGELDATGKMVHWSPVDPKGLVHDGPYSSDSGFWDSYHTMYTILQLLWPTRMKEIISGYINAFNECGWVPQWAAPGHGYSMVGTMSDSAFADCIVKGFTDGYDLEMAFETMKKNAYTEPDKHEKPDDNPRGRRGLVKYRELGYIPRGTSDKLGSMWETLAQTLNHAAADWSIAQACDAVPDQKVFTADEVTDLKARASNWKKVWNSDTKFFHLKDASGDFYANFDEFRYGQDCTEGSHWQYRFHAWQDVDGLAEAYGGLTDMCDALNDLNTLYGGYVHQGSYGHGMTHEMMELGLGTWGQYGHHNQPSHHINYMFLDAPGGDPSDAVKTACIYRGQKYLRETLTELYDPLHFAGDEDNGEMAAWFVLTALGFYTMKPGSDYYNLGYPLFKEVDLKLFETNSVKIVSDCGGDSKPAECHVLGVRGWKHGGSPDVEQIDFARYRAKASDLKVTTHLSFWQTTAPATPPPDTTTSTTTSTTTTTTSTTTTAPAGATTNATTTKASSAETASVGVGLWVAILAAVGMQQ